VARPVSLDSIEEILSSTTEALDATLGPKFELSGMAAECGTRQDEAASLLAQLTLAMANTTLEPYELEVIHRSQKLAAKLNVQDLHRMDTLLKSMEAIVARERRRETWWEQWWPYLAVFVGAVLAIVMKKMGMFK